MVQQKFTDASDEQLIKAISNSDHEAFKNLYYKYFPLLIRFACYHLHSKDTARDLVQEMFFRVWINRQKLDPSKSIKSYLYTSLNNLIINHSRLSFSKTRSLDDLRGKNLRDESSTDFNIDIHTVVQKLPEKLKTVYTLSRVEGYKYSEIAEICEISIKAVEKRMSKAFKILRKVFE